MRPGATVWLSVVLMLLVIAGAGLAGTVHAGGPRFYPHLRGSRLGTVTAPAHNITQGFHRKGNHGLGLAGTILEIFLVIVALGIAYVLVWTFWRNRRAARARPLRSVAVRVPQVLVPAPVPEPEALLTGIEIALQALEEAREPGDAVVRAWLGLEETAAESGIPRDRSETPTEFTSRVMRSAFADDAAVRTLLRLYLRTRFGDHPVGAADVAAVRAALGQLVQNWRLAHPAAVSRSR